MFHYLVEPHVHFHEIQMQAIIITMANLHAEVFLDHQLILGEESLSIISHQRVILVYEHGFFFVLKEGIF